MPETAKYIGAFIRWILKGCKSRLKDEINGSFEPKWLSDYDTENLIIGYVSTIVILGFIIFLFF